MTGRLVLTSFDDEPVETRIAVFDDESDPSQGLASGLGGDLSGGMDIDLDVGLDGDFAAGDLGDLDLESDLAIGDDVASDPVGDLEAGTLEVGDLEAGGPGAAEESELERMIREAEERGRRAAEEEARQDSEFVATELSEILNAAVARFEAEQSERDAAQLSVIHAALKAILPNLARRGLLEETAAELDAALSAPGHRTVRVKVEKRLGAERIEKLRERLADRGVDIVETDERHEPIHLEWPHGGAAFDPESAAERVIEAFSERLEQAEGSK